MGKPKYQKPDGLTLQCVSCKETTIISWEDAKGRTDPVACTRCGMPMVVIKGHWRAAL